MLFLISAILNNKKQGIKVKVTPNLEPVIHVLKITQPKKSSQIRLKQMKQFKGYLNLSDIFNLFSYINQQLSSEESSSYYLMSLNSLGTKVSTNLFMYIDLVSFSIILYEIQTLYLLS